MTAVLPKFYVGIDLGTTNCALSYITQGQHVPTPFPITQVIAPGETSPRPLLPSFLYFSADGEFAKDAFALPWSDANHYVVGDFARTKGATTPSRLVSSAKSWLSHSKVDRNAPILPWGTTETRISPVQASAEYLSHLRHAWDRAHPDAPLAKQEVVLTVPASFDVVARELTLQAAASAGFEQSPRLLEEPQAALYDWVAQSRGAFRHQVASGDRILVVDIGGGTTDFSLISVCESEGKLELERIAVGNHVLLGGDNMDLALAYTVRARLQAEGKALDDWQMVALTHGCRAAKEALLAESPPSSFPLVIPGRSSRLIGGTIRTDLSLAELSTVLLDGFFPKVSLDARLVTPHRIGLLSMGLPYASDAAITRHLAAFLCRGMSSGFPTKVLFNGGVTRSPVVRQRLLEVLSSWAQSAGNLPPDSLSGTDAELAVSRGAAYFGQMAIEGGLRIRSATVESHYIGIQRAELTVPGLPPRLDAVCVAPCGMEEGAELELPQSFGLILGELVSFQTFSSGTRQHDQVGTVVDPAQLTQLPPLETRLGSADAAERDPLDEEEIVEVRLHCRLSEIGTLEISAVDINNGRRWKLSFNIRVD